MQSSFARKYAIMEELDGGFSAGSTPEAFVRLDSWEGRIQASIHVKGLKQGPFKYMLYLVFAEGDKLIPILLGEVKTSYNGMQSGLEVDTKTLAENRVRAESVRFAALSAESQNKKWFPLFASFEKAYKWNESIRQQILVSTQEEDTSPPVKEIEMPLVDEKFEEPKEIVSQSVSQSVRPSENRSLDTSAYRSRGNKERKPLNKRDQTQSRLVRLEEMLANNFSIYHPFKRANSNYKWYRVNDLAQLSNIMYLSGINLPLFANPKILMGLFKYKHILAGIYKDGGNATYFVVGVPAKNDKDNKPFENACRWSPIEIASEEQADDRGMTGYWLIYVSLLSGDIVV